MARGRPWDGGPCWTVSLREAGNEAALDGSS